MLIRWVDSFISSQTHLNLLEIKLFSGHDDSDAVDSVLLSTLTRILYISPNLTSVHLCIKDDTFELPDLFEALKSHKRLVDLTLSLTPPQDSPISLRFAQFCPPQLISLNLEYSFANFEGNILEGVDLPHLTLLECGGPNFYDSFSPLTAESLLQASPKLPNIKRLVIDDPVDVGPADTFGRVNWMRTHLPKSLDLSQVLVRFCLSYFPSAKLFVILTCL